MTPCYASTTGGPRFQKLLADCQSWFNDFRSRHALELVALHEAGHIFYAIRAGVTGLQKRGPTMMWDSRPPKYDCPAISKSSVWWFPNLAAGILAEIKAETAGHICRRELTAEPNDSIAIGHDLDGARKFFDEYATTASGTFEEAIVKAENEILADLRSPAIRRLIWNEARKFYSEIFGEPQKPEPLLEVLGTSDVLDARAVLFDRFS